MERVKPLISVAIYLRGPDLDPESVSEVIGVKPSRSQKRGELKPNSKRFVAKIGVWVLKLTSDSRSVGDMIDDLLCKIGGPAVPLDKIENVQDAHLDIFVAWKDGLNESVEIKLTTARLAKLERLGLSTCFSVDKPDYEPRVPFSKGARIRIPDRKRKRGS